MRLLKTLIFAKLFKTAFKPKQFIKRNKQSVSILKDIAIIIYSVFFQAVKIIYKAASFIFVKLTRYNEAPEQN